MPSPCKHRSTPAIVLAAAAAVALLAPAGVSQATATPAAVIVASVGQQDTSETAHPAMDEARQLISSGLAYLKAQQLEDGSWQPDPRVPPAITALALRAFVDSEEYSVDDAFVKAGFESILDQQLVDGGIYRDLLANYNTAICVSALAAARNEAGDDRYTEEIDLALDYLRRLQWTPDTNPDFPADAPGEEGNVTDENDPFYGGWGYGGRSRGAGRPDLSNAQMALEAMHEAGVPADDPAMQRALVFVSRLQNNRQTNPADWAGDDGGFIYSPAGDRQYESFAGGYETEDGQRRLRSYGSMTYAGLKSMIYAGLTPQDPRVQAAFEWVSGNWDLEANPGMGQANPDNAQHGLFYYYHTLGRALDVYDQPVLETPDGKVDWRVELVNQVARLQHDDGSWNGDPRWQEDNPTLVTSYVVLALEAALKDMREHPPQDPETLD